MIPILYRADETAFTSNGLGRLIDCVSCEVTEERNGIYECAFQYPLTGRFYQEMHDNGGIVGVIHDDAHDIQPFEIYKFSAPIDGIVTFYAHHISYRLSNVIVKPFTAATCAEALLKLKSESATPNPFTFWTDKGTQGTFAVKTPSALRALLGGQQGSILDVYGKGDYKFDKWEVRLYNNRGNDTGVTIRYGKNLANIEHERDESGTFSAVAPYWMKEDVVVTLPEIYVVSPTAAAEVFPWTIQTGEIMQDGRGNDIDFSVPNIVVSPLDLSGSFEDEPTADQLREAALAYLANNEPWIPDENVKVDFVALWQTPEYENVAALQRVSLCDTVSVFYPELGVIQDKQKVIRVVYDVLSERYSSIELGRLRTTLAEAIAHPLQEDLAKELAEKPSQSDLEAAIDYATRLITGGLGGYVVMTTDANGYPQEILIMDTPDINTAVNVWRWNKNGLGHSHNGYNGPFSDVAITQDGRINANLITTGALNANLITTGTMLANRILGGTLTLGGNGNGNGVLQVLDANGNVIGTWNNSGVDLKKGVIFGPSLYTRAFVYSGTQRVKSVYVALHDGISEYMEGGTSTSEQPSAATQLGYITAGKADGAPQYQAGSNGLKFVAVNSQRAQASSLCKTTFQWFLPVDDEGTLRRPMTLLHRNNADADLNGFQLALNGCILLEGKGLKNSGIIWFQEQNGASWDTSEYPLLGVNPNFCGIFGRYGGTYGACDGTRLVGNVDILASTTAYSTAKGNLTVAGTLTVSGTKSRAVDADQYGERLLYCYETPSPLFGDVGDGQIAEDGACYVFLDPVLAQAITTDRYQVFLQKYGDGDAYVSERKPGYFVVKGTPGLSFGWELKAKQADFDQKRLDKTDSFELEPQVDYGAEAASYINELKEGRLSA